jgi:hypothetical protein
LIIGGGKLSVLFLLLRRRRVKGERTMADGLRWALVRRWRR